MRSWLRLHTIETTVKLTQLSNSHRCVCLQIAKIRSAALQNTFYSSQLRLKSDKISDQSETKDDDQPCFEQSSKTNLSGQSLRQFKLMSVEPPKEWVTRFTSHLIPGRNWMRDQFFNRFLRYVSWLEKRLENLSPETYKKYKSLSGGFTFLLKDIMRVTEMATKLHYEPHYHQYTRKELEAYLELPKDIKKVVPLLLIFPLPGGALLCLPLAHYFPRNFLSPHFWTVEQKMQFNQLYHKRRISYYRTLLRKLKRCALKKLPAGEKQNDVINLVEKVEKGEFPSSQDLEKVEALFQTWPFDLEYFSRSHKRALLKANNIHLVVLYQRNLYIEGRMLRAIDDVMVMEGLDNLSDSDLSSVLFARGFNPCGIPRDEQLVHLRDWLDVTTKLDPKSIALYLHLPALLFYNKRKIQKEIEHVDIPDDE